MHSLSREGSPVQEPEPCARPLSQARVYLEQIRSRVNPSAQEGQPATRSTATKRDYLVDAAKQIRLALDREVNEDYQAAFNYYKNGVDLLLKGVQVDPNKERREAVKRKTTQYLKRAEEIFNSHLQENGADHTGGFSSLRFRPIRILSSPVENLKMSKVIAVIDKVLLVQNPSSNETFIVKSLSKCSLVNRERQTIIPQGVPFMVRLLQFYVSDDAVFLHLEHVAGKVKDRRGAEQGTSQPRISRLSQSEQKTSVSVLNTVQQPSVELRSSTLTIVEPLRKSKLKGLSTEEDLDFEDVSHLRTNSQFDVLNQVPVSHVHSDQKVTDSRAVSGKDFELCRTASGSVPVPSDSHTVEGGQSSLPSPFTCPNNELVWVAELVLALESLHQQGIVCQDLNPRNVLLDSSGHVCLTYFGQWSEVEVQCSSKAVEDMYCAPEVGGILEVTEVCDWWSLGALLFELLTGMTLAQCYPSRIQPHTQLRLPDHLSPAAASLVRQLLKWDCRWRLGSGENGVQEIKSHPFFSSVQWTKLNG
uniref:Protein kinase domain-containing protein n=1 Tax=Callorhinchus milii TaxID=7868 RepID=A0A4W3II95_CALMI